MAETLDTLRSYIKQSRSAMIDLESLLTSIKALAPESGGDGESEKAAALEKWLIEQGFKDIKHYDAPDARVSSGVRPNIVATIPGKSDDFTVWVMAHMDVVPVGELSMWNTDPWTVVEKDGKLYGRGVEDNQQGLVSGVFAALAFLKNGVTPAHTVKLLFMADEEVGSKFGIQYLLTQDLFRKNDVIIIPDGGDPQGETIEIAEKNILWLRVHVKGKQSHGSLPNLGRNAFLASCDLALRLHDLENVFNKHDALFNPDYSTFSPTKCQANVDSINIIPGDGVFYMDCRILPCYTLKEVMQEIDVRCKEIAKKHDVVIEYDTPQAEQSPATPKDAPVVKMIADAVKLVHGKTARTVGIGGGTVGAYLRNKGYHAAVWSSLDETCHQPNEYCVIDNMVADAETLAAIFLAE
ncbi:MAG: M20 family metallo-hydrolase [Treponema sp.]|nr:M20 family metallo-hydrolase [Treponema sp.]